jgi:phage shock protein E
MFHRGTITSRRSRWSMLVLSLFVAGAAARGAEHTKDSLDTVKKKIKDGGAILVDVREEKEWKEGHLEKARLIPLSDLKKGLDAEILKKLLGKEKDRVIYVHCAAGGRCLPAADLLKKQGYDVRPLKAGYKQLLEAGFDKAKPEKPEPPKDEDK